MKFKPATKEEFENFLQSYPRILDIDILTICTPERKQYNDFALGMWPETVVCDICLESLYGGEDTYRITYE